MLMQLPGTLKDTIIKITRNATGRAVAYILQRRDTPESEYIDISGLGVQTGAPTPPNGFTTEDLIVISKSRLEELNQILPSPFNEMAINSLTAALKSLESRQALTDKPTNVDMASTYVFAEVPIKGKEYKVAAYKGYLFVASCYMDLWRNMNTGRIARYEDFAGLEKYFEYTGTQPVTWYTRGELKRFINMYPQRKGKKNENN